MRVSINKLTGKMLEAQSGGGVDRSFNKVCNKEWDALEAMRLDTLLQNAIRAGYLEKDIEVKFVTDAEYAILMEASKPEPTEAQLYEAAIKVKEAEILRRQAIAEIEAEKITKG